MCWLLGICITFRIADAIFSTEFSKTFTQTQTTSSITNKTIPASILCARFYGRLQLDHFKS